jgi:chromosome segregation ATPase
MMDMSAQRKALADRIHDFSNKIQVAQAEKDPMAQSLGNVAQWRKLVAEAKAQIAVLDSDAFRIRQEIASLEVRRRNYETKYAGDATERGDIADVIARLNEQMRVLGEELRQLERDRQRVMR